VSVPNESANPLSDAADLLARRIDAADEEFRYVDISPEWRSELLDPKGWDKVLGTFAGTMRLAVALTDLRGRLLGQCHNPQPAWRLARDAWSEAEGGCPFCLAPPASCNGVSDALSAGGAVIVEDRAGLAHVSVPLSLGGRQLGALIAGQVFSRYPEPLLLERVARERAVSPQRLWQAAVQQVPVTRATLFLYGNLLKSLGSAVLGERYAAILHRSLAQTSWRYRLFIEGVKECALYTVDRASRVTSWNSGAERLFGYPESEMVGRDSEKLLVMGSVQREEQQQEVAAAERSGSVEYEGWRVRKDGTRFLASGTLAAMGTGDAREYGRLVRDVTEVRRSEADLQQAQKLEGIGVLAGGIAHDLNNLLTGILGGFSFVKASLPPDSPAYRMAGIAEQSSISAAELIAQLLAYAGKGKFVIARFDFSALIAEMLPLIAASIPKTVKLDLSLTPGLPWMEADASQIRQIVMNVIINGAEAIGAEGGTVRVTTGVAGAGTEIFMQVKDSGSGMSETTKAKMFEPFFTTKFTGRGLGLAAVSGIVRGHKGTMQVDSIPGEGTTFTIAFPAVRADVPGRADQPLLMVSHGADRVVLVVDDEPALREMAGLILKSSGYSVLEAKDGREAVEIFRRDLSKIAAVLLDLTMPIMGGHEAFGAIRQIRPGVPIVISSGYSEESAREAIGRGQVAGFIQKPYTAGKLVEIIGQALEGTAFTTDGSYNTGARH
jgi:PAS domain S-box-containing protein